MHWIPFKKQLSSLMLQRNRFELIVWEKKWYIIVDINTDFQANKHVNDFISLGKSCRKRAFREFLCYYVTNHFSLWCLITLHINPGPPQYGNVRTHSKGNRRCSRKDSFKEKPLYKCLEEGMKTRCPILRHRRF